MKQRLLGILLLCAFLTMVGAPALAHDYDSDDSDYPLRYAAYVVHPVGIAAEYLVLRPIHWIVSRPNLCVIFGHDPRPQDKYFEWNCGVNDKVDPKQNPVENVKPCAKAKCGDVMKPCAKAKCGPATKAKCSADAKMKCKGKAKVAPDCPMCAAIAKEQSCGK